MRAPDPAILDIPSLLQLQTRAGNAATIQLIRQGRHGGFAPTLQRATEVDSLREEESLEEDLQATVPVAAEDWDLEDVEEDLAASDGPAVQRTSGNQAVTRAVGQRRSDGLPPAAVPVQRLLSAKAFKGLTPGLFRGRSGVAAIDTLLTTYEKLGGQPADLVTRDQQLRTIDTACQNYDGSRQAGVTQLLRSITTERKYVRPLARSATAVQKRTNLKQALKDLYAGQDAFLKAQREKHPIGPGQQPYFDEFYKAVRVTLGDDRPQVVRDLILEDVEELKRMAADTKVDKLLRNVLREVLANADKIYFQETMGVASGAVLTGVKDRKKNIKERYRVDLQIEQKQGSPERLSSLVHEMTHIAVQETFKNTAIHLAFRKGMTNKEVVALSKERTEACRRLKEALNGARGTFSEGQYGVLDEKVRYPVEGRKTLKSYANTFKEKGELTQPEYERIIDLVNNGANNTLVEFDTVVNQMLFLMTAWGIPENNPFYKALRPEAVKAYAHRTQR